MDGNKDEALKCLKIARNALESGDKIRALKFVDKARRLDPSIEVDTTLSSLNASVPESQSSNEFMRESSDVSESGPRRRVPTGRSHSESSSSRTSATYTEEQLSIVREIKKKKDYYDILGLEKTCSSEDVKKAYRKLSLKVHPDKNKAPGAEDSFKLVSKAFQCLSVDENRKRYDLSGSDEPVYERRGGAGNGMQGFNGFYDGDIDADEIFRNFFFGGMNSVNTANFGGFSFGPGVRVRTGGVDHGSGRLKPLIQLLPVLVILLLNFLPSSEPVYSLSRSYSYEYRFATAKGVEYFVKSAKFEQQYPPDSNERLAIEQRVDDDYHSYLVHNCRHEWQQLHWGYRRETPFCDALKRFETLAN